MARHRDRRGQLQGEGGVGARRRPRWIQLAKLGYGFVARPVLLNAVTIAAVAVLFNAAFPWRRYPAHWVRRKRPAAVAPSTITHDDVVAAVRSLDSFIDVTEDDLVALYEILAARQRQVG